MKMNPSPTGLRTLASVMCCLNALLWPGSSSQAATFPGNARVEVSDSSGGLSWKTNVNTLTVQCWFKLSAPPGFKENMSILTNKRSVSGGYYAYHFWYDYTKNTVEFRTWGRQAAGTGCQFTLIDRPYQERWYHVAVARDNNNFYAYVDGTQTLTTNRIIGDASSDQGVVIGGPDATGASSGSRDLFGEVQEVTVYRRVLDAETVQDRMFKDQTNQLDLVGYYKLGYSTSPTDFYRNYATTIPTGTDPGIKTGAGQILFEETDRKGEQSLFDSQVNGGRNAVVPLSGAFTWQQSVLSRPVRGVPFDLSIAYCAGASTTLGSGWNHSFDTKAAKDSAIWWKVVNWQGGTEVWEKVTNHLGAASWQTRHGEYRGQLADDGALGNLFWTNGQHQVYRFLQPDHPSLLRGKLMEIKDLNGNMMQLQWDADEKRLTNVVDSANGNYRFNYNSQNLLTNVSYGDWQVLFTYTNFAVSGEPQNFLASKTLTNNSSIYSNVNATFRFYYNTNGQLERVVDPRGNTNVTVRYDEYGRKTNVVDALGQAARLEYGVPDKRQITTTDPEGFQWIETYDRKGRVITRRNPLGHETHSAYDERGNLSSTTDALGNRTLLAYDERANLTNQINALGEVTRWTYHTRFNKPVTQTDPLGWTTTNQYDINGNLLAQSDALGTNTSYTYRTNGLIETQTDANGNTAQFNYDTNGFRIAETDAAGFTKLHLNNDLGWPLAVTNALGEVTTYAYDLNGKTVRTADPLGRVYTGTYDANRNLRTQTDAKGQTASYTYDALNQKTSEVDRSGATNWFAYTRRGKQAAMTNALGHVTINQYDPANRQTNQVDALGNFRTTVYDANGNAVAVINELGQRWTKTYDGLNRVVAESDPFGNTVRTLYDAAGRVRESIAPDGTSTTQSYDGRGRMTNRVDSLGSVWRYDYDRVGNITNVTDARGGHYTMVYSNRNERVLERNQDGKEWHYVYDALERLKTQTEPNGTVRTVEYDAGSRVGSITFSGNTTHRVDSFLYDDNDNPVVLSRSGSGPATISQLAYDAMDRVQQYTDAFSKTVRYTYDPMGRIASLTYPDGKILTNRYDPLDRLTNQLFQFSAQRGYSNTYAYDKAGRLIRRVYPNGIVQTNTFDDAGRLVGLSHVPLIPQPGKLNVAADYAYDRNGNTTLARNQGLFQWPAPERSDETSGFSPAGRITNRVDALNPVTSSFTYRYDASGNMTNCVSADQSWTLTYDEDNRATTGICWTNGALNDVLVVNRYDALGRRIARTVDGVPTGYVLDLSGNMERILCDLDAARNITAWYVHGADLSFKVSPEGSLTCYHPDALGNIVALTDVAMSTIAEYAYTPYGRSLGSTNYSAQILNPYRYAGSQGVMEELPGLYFMRARYYSAEAGVFLSTDPVQNIGATWLPIAYVYAECNPLRFNDPEGEWINFLIGAVLGGGIDLFVQTVVEGKSLKEVNWAQFAGAMVAGALTSGFGSVGAVATGSLVKAVAVRAISQAAIGAVAGAVGKSVEGIAAAAGMPGGKPVSMSDIGTATLAGGASGFLTGGASALGSVKKVQRLGDLKGKLKINRALQQSHRGRRFMFEELQASEKRILRDIDNAKQFTRRNSWGQGPKDLDRSDIFETAVHGGWDLGWEIGQWKIQNR